MLGMWGTACQGLVQLQLRTEHTQARFKPATSGRAPRQAVTDTAPVASRGGGRIPMRVLAH